MRTRSLPALTVVRYPAALAVVVFHEAPRLFSNAPTLEVVDTLYPAVSFFFIVSGFVLTWAYSGRSLTGFWRRRFARIYPTYVLAWFVTYAIYHHRGAAGPIFSSRFLLGLFSLQSWSGSVDTAFAYNGPSWSISCEVAFYLLFPLLLRLLAVRIEQPRVAFYSVFAVMAAMGAIVRLGVGLSQGLQAAILPAQWVYVFPAYRLPEFVMGMLLARAMRSGWRPVGGIARASGSVVIAMAIVAVLNTSLSDVSGHQLPSDLGSLILLLPLTGFVAVLADRDLERPATLRQPRVGESALAILLSGWSVYLTVGLALPAHQPFGIACGELALVLVVTVLIAGVLHRYFERPAERVLVRRLRAGRGSFKEGVGPTVPRFTPLAPGGAPTNKPDVTELPRKFETPVRPHRERRHIDSVSS